MWPNLQETADFVTFTEEILNPKICIVFAHQKVPCFENDTLGAIQKLLNGKILTINIVQPSATHTYVCVSGGHSMLMLKN